MPDTADMQNDEANAAFIVRACNSHDALVKALEALNEAVCALPAEQARALDIVRPHLLARAALKFAKEA